MNFFKIIAIGAEILHALESFIAGEQVEAHISYKGKHYKVTLQEEHA